jgi:mono/diheme cytochrome c family protein
MVRFLAFIGFIGIVVAVAAAAFFFGGFYNIAATEEDPSLVKSALIQVRQASIARHATEAPPSGFDAPAQVEAGARAFATRGCINCHGGPDVEWAKWSEGLRPDPPDLKEVAPNRPPSELFWIVKNGINMTAMPSFGAVGVEDQELWSIVAFLRKLQTVKPEEFKTWTAGVPITTTPAPATTPAPVTTPAPAPAQ